MLFRVQKIPQKKIEEVHQFTRSILLKIEFKKMGAPDPTDRVTICD